MNRTELEIALRNSMNNDFFHNLETYIGCVISPNIKNILKLNGYASASSLSQFDDASIQEIQLFMRTTFHNDMLETNESAIDYFGKFHKVPKQFTLVGGDKRLMLKLAETCKNLVEPTIVPASVDNIIEGSAHNS